MLISFCLLRFDNIYYHMVVVIQIKFPIFNPSSVCLFYYIISVQESGRVHFGLFVFSALRPSTPQSSSLTELIKFIPM